jgi:hypothetical protein
LEGWYYGFQTGRGLETPDILTKTDDNVADWCGEACQRSTGKNDAERCNGAPYP